MRTPLVCTSEPNRRPKATVVCAVRRVASADLQTALALFFSVSDSFSVFTSILRLSTAQHPLSSFYNTPPNFCESGRWHSPNYHKRYTEPDFHPVCFGGSENLAPLGSGSETPHRPCGAHNRRWWLVFSFAMASSGAALAGLEMQPRGAAMSEQTNQEALLFRMSYPSPSWLSLSPFLNHLLLLLRMFFCPAANTTQVVSPYWAVPSKQ